jgi:hypothetical protein
MLYERENSFSSHISIGTGMASEELIDGIV